MTTAIASSGGRCHSVVLTERYARPPRVARTHHRRSHSKLSETQFREGFSAPRYPPTVPPPPPHLGPLAGTWVPPPHPTLDLGRQRRWGGGDYEGPPWGGTLARYLPEVPPSPFKWPLLLDELGQFLPEQTARPILRASHGGSPSRAEKVLTAFRSKVGDDAYNAVRGIR